MTNKYIKGSHISERQTRDILKYFSLDIEATKISLLTGVSRPTVNRILRALRERMVCLCENGSVFEHGYIEFDERCLGPRRIRVKRSRDTNGKHIVFGVIKHGGNVYTQVITNGSIKEVYPFLASKAVLDSTVCPDGFKIYDGLVDFSCQKHYRIPHAGNEPAAGHHAVLEADV
ncbi:MAG: transposase [Thermoguttaceae bacterium]|nr:transposase [Thermoguttaceae bacterium]